MTTVTKDSTIYVLDPTAPGKVSDASLAQGVAGLEGLRWGVLNNQKLNADVVLDVIRDAMVRRHQVQSWQTWEKQIQSAAAPESTIADLCRSVDVLVHGVGD